MPALVSVLYRNGGQERSVGAWAREHGEEAVPLIIVRPNGAVTVGSPGQALDIRAGDTVVAMAAKPDP